MEQFDVVIIGGGMVGASLALALSASTTNALRIALIDQGSLTATPIKSTTPFFPKVSALTEASVNLFKNLRAWSGMISQRICPYHYMKIWDSEGTGEIGFDTSGTTAEALGYIVENCVISNALLARLKETAVKLYPWETELTFQLDGQSNMVTLTDGQTLQSTLLVAADGAESQLRQTANIPLSQKDYLHHAIVTTVETEHYHQDTAWQVFLNAGPLAFLPLTGRRNKHYCSVVWSLIPDQADQIMALNTDKFCKEIGKAFEQKLGKVVHAEPRFYFPLRQRHALHYYRNNVVLVGDAAHTIHPLAGQGANLGFMDVAILTEELKRAIHRHDDIGASHILSRYQRRRKGHNLLMMEAMRGFQNLFAADNIRIRWLRNSGMRAVNQLPLIKQSLVRKAMGITGDIPELMAPTTLFSEGS
ncbi:MAG: FAD-dependent oxidoreductase [Endozoicomonas sp. (ex Botrylloides leachii)]|nr:FAD-dependent oxidoreductase [Endozoicomonas sp. (ex Botrylloides leachii)]